MTNLALDRAPDLAAPTLEWGVNPWRQNPRGAILSVMCILAVWAALFSLRLSPTMTLVLCAVFAAYFYPGLGPVRCRVDDLGVARRGLFWERREWDAIRRAQAGASGILVSPYKYPRRLEVYRALFLPVPRNLADRERLLGELKQRMAEHGL